MGSVGSAEAVPCVFCQIVAGRGPAHVVREDPDTVAFLDIAPATDGHTLVVPREHATDLLSASPEQAGAVMRAAREVARTLVDRLGAPGITIFQANRSAGWQDVFHLHVHVVPRHPGDGLTRPWHPRRAGPAQLAAVAERLR